jgi:hypothetical protein
MSDKELLARLVNNALDFLMRSAKQLRDQPKYSVIDLYAAIELLLKARLMAEHWSLVIAKGRDPDRNAFISGDFISVNLDEAALRLDRAVRSGLTAQELKVFDSVRRHRNKMVHFFHDVEGSENAQKLREQIASEQLTAWYLLHKILLGKWLNVFEPWRSAIEKVDKEIRKNKSYLEVIYTIAEPELKAFKKAGGRVYQCLNCQFSAQKHSGVLKEVNASNCAVCAAEGISLLMPCPKCSKPVLVRNEGFGRCTYCRAPVEPDDVRSALYDTDMAHRAIADGDDDWHLGNCSDCDGFHTVVDLDDFFFCCQCFGRFDRVSPCDWCNELNTADMENSYALGCNMCEGRYGRN